MCISIAGTLNQGYLILSIKCPWFNNTCILYAYMIDAPKSTSKSAKKNAKRRSKSKSDTEGDTFTIVEEVGCVTPPQATPTAAPRKPTDNPIADLKRQIEEAKAVKVCVWRRDGAR